ncbi:hypothetical protein [Candidatus Albibeggiatoa sp. nov. NOAA]|uniref:hypothetical protein n=1 Tax=Candidatus Albibeggiatoa sp. nov. NOAA TaxID=3162724 RepID=UPI0032F784DF|nr:hypothetical protein [Thiotrichaceae bacterium]
MVKQDILEQTQHLKPYDKLALIEELLKSLDDVWFVEAENRFKTCQQERTKTSSHAMPL